MATVGERNGKRIRWADAGSSSSGSEDEAEQGLPLVHTLSYDLPAEGLGLERVWSFDRKTSLVGKPQAPSNVSLPNGFAATPQGTEKSASQGSSDVPGTPPSTLRPSPQPLTMSLITADQKAPSATTTRKRSRAPSTPSDGQEIASGCVDAPLERTASVLAGGNKLGQELLKMLKAPLVPTTEPPVSEAAVPLISEVEPDQPEETEDGPADGEDDWTRRGEKRTAIIASIKAGPAYKEHKARHKRTSHGTAAPGTPDSADRSISKRAWELIVMQWRTAVQDDGAGPPTSWASKGNGRSRPHHHPRQGGRASGARRAARNDDC